MGTGARNAVAAVLGDSFVRRGFELFAVWVLLYVFFDVARIEAAAGRRILVFLFLALSVYALRCDRQRLRYPEERRFWADLELAFGSWLLVSAVYLFFPRPHKPFAAEAAAEVLLGAFYTFFLIAVERRPDRRSRWRPVGVEEALTWPAVLVFVFGLYVYFVLIPRLATPRDSVLYFYVFLDLFLLGKLLYAWATAWGEKWRTLYLVLLAVPALMLFTDLVELQQDLANVAWPFGTWPDLLTVLPMLAVVVAARLRTQPFPEEIRDDIVRPSLSGPSGKSMIAALAFPIIHFLCSAFGLLSPETLLPREFVVGWWLLLLGMLSLVQHRRLEKEAEALWRERKQVERSLDRSEKDLRLMLEREETEEALLASDERFARAFHSSREAMKIVSLRTGRHVEVNASFETMTGFSREDLDSGRFTLWGDTVRFGAMLAALQADGLVRDIELPFRTREGEEHLARLGMELIELDGEPCRLTVVEDVTAARRDGASLHGQSAWLARLADAVRVVDGDDRIRYWSPAAERLYGWSEEEALGRRSAELLHADEERASEIRRALEKSGSWSGELRERRRDGLVLAVGCHFVDLRAGDGEERSTLVLSARAHPPDAL